MKAAVLHKPGDIRHKAFENPPRQQHTNVILKAVSATIRIPVTYTLSGGIF